MSDLTAAPRSLCCECNAPPGECSHTGHRYLPPIKYELLGGSTPRDWRWKAPDAERWRLDNPQSSWPETHALRPAAAAEPINHLIARLEAWVEVGDDLEGTLRDAYARDPLTISRLVSTVCDKAERRELRSPGGWLIASLRKLHLT